jgi:DNA-binding GntR family transcriptional regulator
VVTKLREAILGGVLTPGEQLRENALAESLGVSRGPIREALNCLEREGLVIMRPNRSAIVARLSRQDVDEVYILRQALERLAVQFVCRKGTPADIAKLQGVVDAMARAFERKVAEAEAAELDLNFHDELYRASGHQRLLGFWSSLRPQIYIFLLKRNVAAPDFRELTVKGHQEVVDAIRDRDEARAVAVIEAHLQAGYQRVLSGYSPE